MKRWKNRRTFPHEKTNKSAAANWPAVRKVLVAHCRFIPHLKNDLADVLLSVKHSAKTGTAVGKIVKDICRRSAIGKHREGEAIACRIG
jgi:hypothetical protein